MINQKESNAIKAKFLNKLYDYIQKDEKERKLILTLMISSFVIALILYIFIKVYFHSICKMLRK